MCNPYKATTKDYFQSWKMPTKSLPSKKKKAKKPINESHLTGWKLFIFGLNDSID